MSCMLSCQCLNVIIHVREIPISGLSTLGQLSGNFSVEELDHPFFSKGASPVHLDLAGIAECQKFLVRSSKIGKWNVHECIVCHTFTHAYFEDQVLVSSLLICDSERINSLRHCEGYSSVFKLVLPSLLDERPLPPLSPTDFPQNRSHETEKAIGNIQQQVSRFLRKTEVQVEENIRTYTEQQQSKLTGIQQRVRSDRQTMMRLLATATQDSCNTDESILVLSNPFLKEPIQGFSTGHFGGNSPPFPYDDALKGDDEVTALAPLPLPAAIVGLHLGGKGRHHRRHQVGASKISTPGPKGSVRVAQSLDSQELFDMEGMEVTDGFNVENKFNDSDEEAEDFYHEETDEGIHIPRSRIHDNQDVAQSVPVDIPDMAVEARMFRESLDADKCESGSHNIAASIRALARSVHTTSADLFGELPRPKLRDFDTSE